MQERATWQRKHQAFLHDRAQQVAVSWFFRRDLRRFSALKFLDLSTSIVPFNARRAAYFGAEKPSEKPAEGSAAGKKAAGNEENVPRKKRRSSRLRGVRADSGSAATAKATTAGKSLSEPMRAYNYAMLKSQFDFVAQSLKHLGNLQVRLLAPT